MPTKPAFLALEAALLLGACSDQTSQQSNPPVASQPAAASKATAVREGRGFDFYVLALSWSPSYCELEGERANRQQCGATRSYGFVVHGLWPQYEHGYPSNCASAERDVSNDLARSMYDLMPSTGLIRQQWRKHGSCSGLTPSDYFDVVRAARNRVVIPSELQRSTQRQSVDPDEIETAFIQANAGLPPRGIAVACDGRLMEEVRICLTKSLQFRACPEVDKRECRARSVTLPAMR